MTLVITSRTGSNYGATDIRTGSTIEITAPALGATAGIPGIAIWIDGDEPAANDTFDGGNTQNINGTIYLPGRHVNIPEAHPPPLDATTDRPSGYLHRISYLRHDCRGVGLSDPDPPSLLTE
jgi:hypothetical protein